MLYRGEPDWEESESEKNQAPSEAPSKVVAGAKEAERFLSDALPYRSDARERFLSFVAHEMRNPLASSLWAAEMLARGVDDSARAERLSALSARSLRRLRHLLEDFFAIERMSPRYSEGETELQEAISRAMEPHDLEPDGVAANIETLEPLEGLRIPIHPDPLDALLHACLRRSSRVSAGELPVAVSAELGAGEMGLKLSFYREGLEVDVLDPPLLTPAGAEGEGTTFTLIFAHLLAERLGVRMWAEQREQGSALCLRLPVRRS